MGVRKWLVSSTLAWLASSPSLIHSQPPLTVVPGEAGRVIEVRIVARKPEGGARTVRVSRGETIVLKILADEKMSIHVHGYDVRRDVAVGSVTSLPIVTRWVGRFPVTAHLDPRGAGQHAAEPTLLYLEVHPE